MSLWQLAYLQKERAYTSDSGVIYIDLPANEQISVIGIDFQVTSGAAASVIGTRCILDVITDISVLLEGSKTAFKADPWVASHLAFLPERKMPPHKLATRGYQNCRVPILFGRFPKDEEYMLDTGKYANAQLQISYALNTTYESTGTTVLSVWYLRPVVKLTPRGFIRSRTIHSYTSGASAEFKQVDLPVGLPWLRMGTRFYDADGYRYLGLLDLDLSIDDGRMHLFNGRYEDLRALNGLDFGWDIPGPIAEHMASDADDMLTFMNETRSIILTERSADGVAMAAQSIKSDTWNLKWTTMTNKTLAYQCVGSQPFGGIVIANCERQPFDAPAHGDAMIEYSLDAYAQNIYTWLQEVVEGTL